ncbi:MAG: hypoxanthine phosphoribosyltransferase [Deltaproteobacteria bacterium CG07_land_8_20_14_0_80_38_7]|nr:MAG: hypoxanthine phosphoribosyltransferase [Deltaproteobacteria bacterium CG07_land_8_20_14_0_80_38_7]
MKEIEILLNEAKIKEKVKQLGSQISKDYKDRELVVVGVLKGSFIFMSDLVRSIETPLYCDFLRVSSYHDDRSTGTIRMEFDMTQPITNKDVLLVEDIVDSGKTLRHLLKHLKTKEPKSLKVATLLYKELGLGNKELINYLGFEVPNRYVIGYGLDSNGLYRSLPYVGAYK